MRGWKSAYHIARGDDISNLAHYNLITHAATCAHGGPMHDDGMRSDI